MAVRGLAPVEDVSIIERLRRCVPLPERRLGEPEVEDLHQEPMWQPAVRQHRDRCAALAVGSDSRLEVGMAMGEMLGEEAMVVSVTGADEGEEQRVGVGDTRRREWCAEDDEPAGHARELSLN